LAQAIEVALPAPALISNRRTSAMSQISIVSD
jgi:hypothetical protein